jgi:hypothetical protein
VKKKRPTSKAPAHAAPQLSFETVRGSLEHALCQEIDGTRRLLELKVLRQYEEDLGLREELGRKLARQQIKVLRLRRASAALQQRLDALLKKKTPATTQQETCEQRAARRSRVVMPILKRLGISVSAWAKRAGVGNDSAYNYLNGKRRTITLPNRKALAEAIELIPEQLPE